MAICTPKSVLGTSELQTLNLGVLGPGANGGVESPNVERGLSVWDKDAPPLRQFAFWHWQGPANPSG